MEPHIIKLHLQHHYFIMLNINPCYIITYSLFIMVRKNQHIKLKMRTQQVNPTKAKYLMLYKCSVYLSNYFYHNSLLSYYFNNYITHICFLPSMCYIGRLWSLRRNLMRDFMKCTYRNCLLAFAWYYKIYIIYNITVIFFY